MANSSTVSSGTDILASEYNSLRADVLDPSTGHDHEGADGRTLTLDAIPSVTATATEINQATDGIGASVTAANLTAVTDDSVLTNKHFHKRTVVVATRAVTDGAGTQNIAHGLGATPKWVRITMSATTVNGAGAASVGVLAGGSVGMIFVNNSGTGNGGTDTTNIVKYMFQNGTYQATASVDGTNVVLTWSVTSSPDSQTLSMLVEVGV